MTDRPIIFSAPMVRALLDGRKTMTRRLAWREAQSGQASRQRAPSPWQRVAVGDRLLVRESHQIQATGAAPNWAAQGIWYAADGEYLPLREPVSYVGKCTIGLRTVPSVHMPRWASRITLTVTETKIGRLQDISEADAIAEGLEVAPHAAIDFARNRPVPGYFVDLPNGHKIGGTLGAVRVFRELWGALHGAGSWDANPDVIAIRFTVEQRNIDAKEPA